MKGFVDFAHTDRHRHGADGFVCLGDVRAEGTDLLAGQGCHVVAILVRTGQVIIAKRLVDQELDAELRQFFLEVGQILVGGRRDFHRLARALEDEGDLIGAPVQKLVGIVARHDRRHVDGATTGEGQHLVTGPKTAREGNLDLDASTGPLGHGRREVFLSLNEGRVSKIVTPTQGHFLRTRCAGG